MHRLLKIGGFAGALLALALAFAPSPKAEQVPPAISGYVFFDNNGNGIPDAGERRLGGAALSLLRHGEDGEHIVSSQTTGEQGDFSLQPPAFGEYSLKVLLPEGFVFSAPAKEGLRVLSASGRASSSPRFTLSERDPAPLPAAIGATKKTSFIRVIAFGDSNANGGRFSSEPLLRDVRIDLVVEVDGEPYTIASARTDREGTATFRDLGPGVYRIAAQLPEPYIIGPLGEKINLFYNCIPPSDSAAGISAPFVLPQGGSVGLGVGGVETGSAAGRLWADSNMDGFMDRDEPGFSGALLHLFNEALGVRRELRPDPDGGFAFEALQSGDYELSVSLPDGYMFTLPGGDSLLHSGYSAQESIPVRVAPGAVAAVGNIGVMPATSLKLQAFHDMNVNGLMDEGEPGFAGALVEVLQDGAVLASARSDRDGVALVPRLRGGDVTLRCSLPDGQVFTVPGGPEGNAFTAPLAVSSVTLGLPLAHGVQTSLFAGVTLPASVEGTLYEDTNINGAYEEGEPKLSGFLVQALNRQGEPVLETRSEGDGRYRLSGLIPGDYTLRVYLSSPYVASPPADSTLPMASALLRQTPEYGETDPLSLAPGQSRSGVDGALFRSAVIEGSVFVGNEAIGFAGAAGGIPGVFVELLDEDLIPVSDYTVAFTDENGRFLLKGALPGTYCLRFVLPDDTAFTRPFSDEEAVFGELFRVSSGETLEASPLFAEPTGLLEGTVFLDRDADGTAGNADTLMAGAVIRLQNESGGAVMESLSQADGAYQLSGIRQGRYSLSVSAPEGTFVGFSPSSPVPPSVSNFSRTQLEIRMGETVAGRNIALVPAASLSGVLFFDENLDASFSQGERVPAVTEFKLRHLLSGIEFSVQSEGEGAFSVPALFPGDYVLTMDLPDDTILYAPAGSRSPSGRWSAPASLPPQGGGARLDLALVQFGTIEGTVWNLDGSLEGVESLVVSLYRQGSSQPLKEAVTDALGAFSFDALYPGSYVLGLSLEEPYRFARTLDTSLRPSLIVAGELPPGDGEQFSETFPLTMGERKSRADIGIGSPGKLGDFAWLDLDGDGMQDAGEPGIPGIQIRLYQHGTLVAQTQTDLYGRYLFDALYPGSYLVEVSFPAELKPTVRQTAYPLVASVLTQAADTLARAEDISVPSGGRNLNCDFGFVLLRDGVLPREMQQLPKKDWTPYTDVVPSR